MSVVPGLGLKVNEVGRQLVDIVDEGSCKGVQYTGLWMNGPDFLGNATRSAAGILSYALFYPDKTHRFGGYIVTDVAPGRDYLSIMQCLALDKKDIAEDEEVNGAARKQLVANAEERGGLLACVSDVCERLRVPLGAMVLWAQNKEDELPTIATFHSVATLPPQRALSVLRFALWERPAGRAVEIEVES